MLSEHEKGNAARTHVDEEGGKETPQEDGLPQVGEGVQGLVGPDFRVGRLIMLGAVGDHGFRPPHEDEAYDEPPPKRQSCNGLQEYHARTPPSLRVHLTSYYILGSGN